MTEMLRTPDPNFRRFSDRLDARMDAVTTVNRLFERFTDTQVVVAQRIMMGQSVGEIAHGLGSTDDAVRKSLEKMGNKARRMETENAVIEMSVNK